MLGADSAVEGVVILANLFCSSFNCGPLLAVAGGEVGGAALEFEPRLAGGGGAIVRWRGGTGGEAWRPISSPGTDTPA